MIREIVASDRQAILSIARESGLFSEPELGEIEAMIEGFVAGERQAGHTWVTYVNDGPSGVAYFAPEGFSDGVWNGEFTTEDHDTNPDTQARSLEPA